MVSAFHNGCIGIFYQRALLPFATHPFVTDCYSRSKIAGFPCVESALTVYYRACVHIQLYDTVT